MKYPRKCPFCGEIPEWVSNEEIYGKRYGTSYMVWLCRKCKAYVGCHNNTKAPLGTMAGKELRGWRMATHRKLDPLWQDGRYKRAEVYKMLKEHFGQEIHVGSSDVARCNAIIQWVNQLTPPKD